MNNSPFPHRQHLSRQQYPRCMLPVDNRATYELCHNKEPHGTKKMSHFALAVQEKKYLRWLLLALLVGISFATWRVSASRAATQQQGPHRGPYPSTTDACAACHRAHTGRNPFLIVPQTTSTGYTPTTRVASLSEAPPPMRAAEIDRFCFTCHNGTGSDETVAISTHGNRDADNRTQHAFQLACTECHDPHGSTNAMSIRTTLFPGKGTHGSHVGPIQFRATTGPHSFDDGQSPPNTRLCVACHEALGTLQHSGGADHIGNFDLTGQNCTTCHPHSADAFPETVDGFMPASNAQDLLIAQALVDLEVTQEVVPSPPIAGMPFTYILTVTNHGPQDAWEVVLTATLPTDVALVEVHNPTKHDCTIEKGVLTCPLGDLLHDTRVTITLKVMPAVYLEGALVNRVEVTALQPDPIPKNNLITGEEIIQRQADLQVTQQTPEKVMLGEQAVFTVTVSNAGPSLATQVVLEHHLQGFRALSVTAEQGTCDATSDIITCQLLTLPVGADTTITIIAQAEPQPKENPDPIGQSQTQTTAQETDPVSDNNVSSATIPIVWDADLSLQAQVSRAMVLPQEEVTFALQVINAGPKTASDIVFKTILPQDAVLHKAVASQGKCTAEEQNITCKLDALPAQATATITLTLQAPTEEGEYQLAFAVQGAFAEPTPNDNQASLVLTVFNGADVSTAWQGPTQVALGEEITYLAEIVNTGPGEASEITWQHPIPTSLTFNAITASQGGACKIADQIVTCHWERLAVDERGEIVLVGQVALDAEAPLTLEAAVAAAEADPNPENNTSSQQVTLAPQADVHIAFSNLPTVALPGNEVVYTLTVTNAGPSIAHDLVLTHTLPEALKWTSTTLEDNQDNCTWQEDKHQIICQWTILAPNAAIVVNIQTQVVQGVATAPLEAKITAAEADPNPGNNAITASIATIPPTATPTPTPTPTPSPTPSPTTTFTPSPTPSPTPPPTPTDTPAATPTTTKTPTPESPTATTSPETPTPTPEATPSTFKGSSAYTARNSPSGPITWKSSVSSAPPRSQGATSASARPHPNIWA